MACMAHAKEGGEWKVVNEANMRLREELRRSDAERLAAHYETQRYKEQAHTHAHTHARVWKHVRTCSHVCSGGWRAGEVADT